MNPTLAKLRAGLGKNKAALGVVGAAAVALIAWRARSGSASSSAGAPASGGSVSTAPAYYSVGGQTSAATGYDSTASDVYNAIQPQLEELRDLAESLQSPIPLPVPETPAPATPAPAPTPAAPVDQRRSTIAGWYETFLGRAASRREVNWWDSTGKSLTEIRQGIVGSTEAKNTKK